MNRIGVLPDGGCAPVPPLPRRLRRSRSNGVDLSTSVGGVRLPSPVLTAAGTAGHGAELAPYTDLAALGAVVVKSLSPEPWKGNPAPRVAGVAGGMINSVGLQNPGVEAWLAADLPALRATGARVVASIWGFRVADYAEAAALLHAGAAGGLTALEVNVSCPNIEDRRHMFGHSPEATAEVIAAVRDAAPGLPLWAKLSPNVTDITEIAGAALGAGADALTLVNTVMGMAIDVEARTFRLGNGGGGVSGPAIRPVAVRAIHDCRKAFPDAPIVGVGGVTRGVDAVELLMAGAQAVQVGTATFYDPAAPGRVLAELAHWCRERRIGAVRDLIGVVHGRQ